MKLLQGLFFVFFFNDTATTEIYTLSLHDALPISPPPHVAGLRDRAGRPADQDPGRPGGRRPRGLPDRKSTRLNSSHSQISYAVFCLKKKKRTEPRSCISLPSFHYMMVTHTAHSHA